MKQRENQQELMKELGGLYNFMKMYFRYRARNDDSSMETYLSASEMTVKSIQKLLREDTGNLIKMPRPKR